MCSHNLVHLAKKMNHPDTFALLNRLGLIQKTAGPDGKEVLDPPHEVIHKLMNLTLHCLGAIRNLVNILSLFYFAFEYLALSYVLQPSSYLISSHLISFHFISSHFIILSYLILSYLNFSSHPLYHFNKII